MPIINKDGSNKTYSVEELEEKANLMRGYSLISLRTAGSGHSGGTLSIMDIAAGLYLKQIRHKPHEPNWEDRDRVIWSAGHKAPALYTALAMSGYFDVKETALLRKLNSRFQGHPSSLELPGVEISTGSLGQGLGLAAGIALAGKLNKKNYNVYCIMGDGEQQEGSIWEAAMFASHHNLDNLVGIIDKNGLQIDGEVKNVMDIDPLADKYKSFGWNVLEINGHNMQQILDAFDKASVMKNNPTLIIAHTTKGKGVSFMEEKIEWHGKAPTHNQLLEALGPKELNLEGKLPITEMLKLAEDYQKKVDADLAKITPKFSRDYAWNSQTNMKVEMKPTRKGFGECLDREGKDERIVCLGADISDSITLSDFHKNHPERKNRFISVGIAEQNATTVAAGLAREEKIPVFGSYAVFSAGRNLDQIRTSICYPNLNVKVVGAHGGVSVGPDGATHQALEDLFSIVGLPNMHVFVPCDSVETDKATKTMLSDVNGPCYIRFAREATPIITTNKTPYKFGTANIIRFRGEQDNFIDAFETKLSTDYQSENEDVAIVACGPMVSEAMKAAWILKREKNLETRVINMHSLKPLDKKAIINAARDCKVLITAEEHQVGGLSGLVSRALQNTGKNINAEIGVPDKFGKSGEPWELMKEFGLLGENIAKKANEVYSQQ